MKAKIDWYKEVLELEPGSKVFFPLARLLAENGQLQDALSTLRLGLDRHPEFMEARLYYIDLLYKNDQIAQCEPQIGKLTRLFAQYPGFWEAWGACASSTGNKRDLALALRFLAVLFRHPGTDLGDVLEQGLSALALATPPSAPEAEAGPALLSRDAAPNPSAVPVDMPSSVFAALTATVDEASPAAECGEAEEAGEPFTLRTKSMADVLAGQSDIGGALEIYHELALRAESPEEREEINERIVQLSASQAPDASASSLPPGLAPPAGKQRMQHLLESLAERLEARAQG